MITHHTDLLNALIEKYSLKSYLEIGVQNPANNFDKINVSFVKIGVDPEFDGDIKGNGFALLKLSSDEFFEMNDNTGRFDLIFIDGLHHADQVRRDFENALRCLSEHGFIVIHDVLPTHEHGTLVPRQSKQWWGTVYKWAMNISTYPGIGYKTFNIDEGCMLVWKDVSKVANTEGYREDYNNYLNCATEAMNVTDTVEI